MIMSLLNYGGMTAKIRAMEGRLLKADDYQLIAGMSSVNEFLTYIISHPSYANAFAQADESRLHRGEIEKYLQLGLYNDYARIHTFAKPEQKKFLQIFFKRYEILIIKTFLRTLFDHRDIHYDTSLISEHFRNQSDIDYGRMAAAKTVDEFFEVIKSSEYYPILEVLRNAGVQTLFDYEFALDIYFFRHLWKMKNKTLKNKDLEVITKLYGAEIDLLNILWIVRSKKFYQVEPLTIYNMIIPIHYKLKPAMVSRLIDASSEEELSALLRQTYYAKTARKLGELSDPEDLYEKVISSYQRKAARKYPYSIAIISHYLYRKEQEINHLTTALECIRYQLDASEILKYIT